MRGQLRPEFLNRLGHPTDRAQSTRRRRTHGPRRNPRRRRRRRRPDSRRPARRRRHRRPRGHLPPPPGRRRPRSDERRTAPLTGTNSSARGLTPAGSFRLACRSHITQGPGEVRATTNRGCCRAGLAATESIAPAAAPSATPQPSVEPEMPAWTAGLLDARDTRSSISFVENFSTPPMMMSLRRAGGAIPRQVGAGAEPAGIT